MTLEPSDRLTTQLPPPCATLEDHANAYAYLRRRHAGGTLLPFLDGTEDILADYVAALGLRGAFA